MKYLILFISTLLFSAGFPTLAGAHDYPIFPVDINLKIEPTLMTVTIKNNAIYWTDELLGVGRLAENWPDKTKIRAEDLVNSYLQMQVDGTLIKGRLFTSRLIEEPFNEDNSYIVCKLKYPLPPGANSISGKAEFFKEYWAEETGAHPGGTGPEELKGEPSKIFASNISVSGHKNEKFSVPIENPSFTLPIRSNFVPRVEYSKESLWEGLLLTKSKIWFSAFLLAALLILPLRKHLFGGWGLLIFIGCISFFLKISLGAQTQNILPIILTILLSAVALISLPPALWMAALGISAACWGSIWRNEYAATQNPGFIEPQLAFLLGKMIFLVLITGIILGAFWAYRKKQSFLSESMAPSICRTHARFAALFILVAAILQLGRFFMR